jgi:pimeloyl-ACP methyl ester carboxylesterase
MEQPVTFTNKDGKKLFGIIHAPEVSTVKNKTGIIILNPGIKYRVAPHRLNVKLARHLCDEGYYVLRFDPHGIGDSEGELPENVLIPEVWAKIQTGEFVSDTLSSVEFFFEKYGFNDVTLIGDCGGAITALLSAAKNNKVTGLVLIDLPINLARSDISFADGIVASGNRINHFFYGYLRNLVSLQAWYRFLTMKSNYGALRKTLVLKYHNILFRSKSLQKSADSNLLSEGKKLNQLVFKSFEALTVNHLKILFILAENGPEIETFQLYIQDSVIKRTLQDAKTKVMIEVFTIEGANHIYSLYAWQESLMNKIVKWMI